MSESYFTPIGRIVMGDLFDPQTTDADGNPLTVKRGANAGQKRVNYFIGLAIQKTDPNWPALWEYITNEAAKVFPQYFPGGVCNLPTFAFKVMDGDDATPNAEGRCPKDREGFPGCWILKLNSGYAPQVLNMAGDGFITDPNAVKRGYFVQAAIAVNSNNSAQKPGIYLNLNAVQLKAYGDEIKIGPDYRSAFAGAPTSPLPAGASMTPTGGATGPAAGPAMGPAAGPAMGPAAGPAMGPAAGPAMVSPIAPPPPPPTTVQPAHDFGAVRYIVNGQPYTREALMAQGYTDEHFKTMQTA